MAGTVRLYVVSDIHASEKAWRKMLNAARMRPCDPVGQSDRGPAGVDHVAHGQPVRRVRKSPSS